MLFPMSFLTDATLFIETASKTVALQPFLFWASLLEELVAPVPTFFVAVIAAPLVHEAGYGTLMILWLALLSAIGKTIAAWVYYVLGDKAEDWVTGRWGRVLGLSHESIEAWGPKMGKGWKDEIVLTLLRVMPFFPSAPISILAGVVKQRLRSYLSATLIGYTIRNYVLFVFAHEGFDWWKGWVQAFNEASFSLTGFIIIAVILFVAWAYWKGHHQTLGQKIIDAFRGKSS